MNLAVVGLGMVSPVGMSPAEHVFFPRARLPAPPPRVFLDAEDQRLLVAYSPVLGARAHVAERLAWLSTRAAADAVAPLRAAGLDHLRLVVCASAPRPGLASDATAEAERALATQVRGAVQARVTGEAGVFAALDPLERSLRENARRGLPAGGLIVAHDSLIALDAVAAEVTSPPSPWALTSPPAAEGAGALAVMLPEDARAVGLEVLGTLTGAALARGQARDDNDETPDGAAMATALRALPAAPPVHAVFGQEAVDGLRLREWRTAAARLADRFDARCVFDSIESYTGRVGAAAGALSLAYGIARHWHGVGPAERTFFAWAISRDGVRGIASCRAGAS